MPTRSQLVQELLRVTPLSGDVIGIVAQYYPEIPCVEETVVRLWSFHHETFEKKLYEAIQWVATQDNGSMVDIPEWAHFIREIVSEYGYPHFIQGDTVYIGLPHHFEHYDYDSPVPASWASRMIIQSFSKDREVEESNDEEEPSRVKRE
jgi:hypothetical protein